MTQEINVFEEAARQKLRFPSVQGDLMVENLFEIPLVSKSSNRADLESIAQGLARSLREQSEESFVEKRTNPLRAKLSLQLEVVKAVIARRQDDNTKATLDKARRARLDALREAAANKEVSALEGMSPEALNEEIAKLERELA